jgi:8-oxo-dGTP diphosphatase
MNFTATLPQKRMAAGALLRHGDKLLLVQTTYNEGWTVPGGVIEANESPRAACEREIAEELGLRLQVGRLLCVDYMPPLNDRTESLQLIFAGGELTATQLKAINLQPDELKSFRLVTLDEALTLVGDHLQGRLPAALAAWRTGATVYLEDGQARADEQY